MVVQARVRGGKLSVQAADPSSPEVSQGLQKWLSSRLEGGGQLVISEISRPSSGFSAQTWLIDLADATSGEHRRRVVARVETSDPAVYPRQSPDHPDNPAGDIEVALQYEVMKALNKSGRVPLAGLIGYEADPSLLGQPFFVMDFVSGEVPKESPPYPSEGFFTELDPAGRTKMLQNGLQVVADLHSVPWREVGLEWLVAPGRTPTIATQVDIWKSFGVDELRGRVHPSLDTAWKLLAEKAPKESPPALSWGDARPGNMIWQQGEVAAITDFEAAAIAPPELDLGWWLLFDRTMHEAVGNTERLPGDLTREEQCEYYAKITGRDVSQIRWYETFAAARYCVIVVRVMNRAVARGLMPEDQKIWLENPASEALDQILAS